MMGEDFIDVKAQAHLHKELGNYTTHPVSMSMQSGRRSVLHTGPEQSHLYDALPPGLGQFGLSRNEKRLVVGGAIVAALYWAWKKYK